MKMIKLLPFSDLNLKAVKSCVLRVHYGIDEYRDVFMLPQQLKLHHFAIHENDFDKAVDFELIIQYKNGSSEKLNRHQKSNWSFECKHGGEVNPYLRKNNDCIYEDSEFGKNTVLNILDSQFAETLKISSETVGTKNLIYYSIGGDLNYLSLLELSVSSVLEKSESKNFEFLFICPESWQNQISNFSCLQGFTYHFHTVEDSQDGVEISKNKTKVYDFSDIDSFCKILFLDADIVAIKDIAAIFNAHLEENKLYIANANRYTVDLKSHLGSYHGLCFWSEERYKNLCDNNIYPLNAGQFLFLNSARMRQHFSNLRWLMQSWPGEYFFEQSFMNHYFCGYNLTNQVTFHNQVKIYSVVDQVNYSPEIKDSEVIIHFIAPCLNPIAKSNFIRDYLNAYLS